MSSNLPNVPIVAEHEGVSDAHSQTLSLRFKWLMSYREKAAFVNLLQKLHPACSITIGNLYGGSLDVLSRYSKQVYALDISAENQEELKPHLPNVEFLREDSGVSLPILIEKIQDANTELQFVLVDGDSTYEGAKRNLESLLRFKPKSEMCILIRESFNPVIRDALLDVDWASNPHVACVEVDFISGNLLVSRETSGGVWGGFCLVILQGEPRRKTLEIAQSGTARQRAAVRNSRF